MKTIHLIGAPTDIGASVRGAGLGPDALRVAGLPQALRDRQLQVIDSGNLAGPPNPWEPPRDGFRHLPEVIAWNRSIYTAVHDALTAGQLPVLLGGDHCLAIGSISAVARHCKAAGKQLRVLWFDAHADTNTAHITPSGNIHGMPVACLLGHGPEALTHLGGEVALQARELCQIGVRSVDAGERAFVKELGFEVFDMRYIDEFGMRAVMELALAGTDSNTHLHVSFDMDCMDPEIAPGVGTAVRGGPSYRETQLCMEMIADTGLLGSLDLVELNPALDVRNQTAELAVDLIESLFGKSTLMRRAPADGP
ncbi:arginase [Polaromonas jejuensis]|uniref:Arginase n=1 Tax=Polaromonas jejuensis TaxID=457502 RepID=A0ABW0QCN7_9BURK|nr:arginase [Polaromonas jejuensis]